MADEFCLKMPDFHLTFRDLLHSVNLRHGTNDFTSLPKEGVLRIFFALKNPTASAAFESANWVPKTSTLPIDHRSRHHGRYSYMSKFSVPKKNYRQSFYNNTSWQEKSHHHLTVQKLFLYNILINIYLPAIVRSYDIQQSRTVPLKRILIFRVVECNFTC